MVGTLVQFEFRAKTCCIQKHKHQILKMYDEDEKRIAFGKIYGNWSFLSCVISLSTALFWSSFKVETDSATLVAKFGETLSDLRFSFGQFFVLIFIILWTKRKSCYRGALYSPPLEEFSVNWNSLQKAPFARRFGVKLRYWIQKLTPFKVAVRFCIALVTCWALAAYIVICFGAPMFSDQIKTAGFVTCLCIHSLWPVILIEGSDLSKISKVVRGQDLDPLAKVLYRNAGGAILGSWLGAFPIPLDWDRPWQAWPLTCVIGCYSGLVVAQLWSLYDIHRAQNKRKTLIGVVKNKKEA